ncbi:MAG: hypothetical protein ACXVEF_16295 [Polyangiales bacterium]
MTALDRVLPTPRLVEVQHVELAIPPEQAWEIVRHEDLARRSALVRALFAIRTTGDEVSLCIDDVHASAERPGFQVLIDDPPREVVVGAIGKVWLLDIPFEHVANAYAFERFADPGFVKVAWAMRVLPHGDRDARVEIEVRVDATDDASWQKFRAYFRLIGPGSRFIRRTLLSSLARELGSPESKESARALPGDELLSDARGQLDHAITIHARPDVIWPWLVQMGCDRAGFYSIDLLDNGGHASARELHPELQDVRVGQVLPATPGSQEGFEVLAIEPNRALVLGGLFDPVAKRQLPFASERPDRYWHVTWAFVLEPLDAENTRLHVRARGAYPASGAFHATWVRPVHALMETTQLRGLKARAEGRLARDDARDVLAGTVGAARMVFGLMTPFLRKARTHWGLDEATASRSLPGDNLVPHARWSWTHGVEIAASAAEVWPWIAQIGANKGGFYSYQWLENVAGCALRNAETIHPEWEVKVGDGLSLHPKMPPLKVVAMERGQWFVVHGPADEAARAAGKPWVTGSWLFYVEPLGSDKCRLISRYRADCSSDLLTRLSFGPTIVEPVGFAMDRRMLLGLKDRAERRARHGK